MYNRYDEPRSGFLIILSVLCYFIATSIAAIPIAVAQSLTSVSFWAYLSAPGLSQAVCDLAGAGGVLFLYRQVYRRPLRFTGLVREGWGRDFALGALLGALQMLLVLGALLAARQYAITAVDGSVLLRGSFWVVLVHYIVVAVTEEFWFRGFMMTAMKTTRSPAAIVLVPAVVFALMHFGYSFWARAAVFFCGIFYGLVFVYTGKIWLSTGLHLMWNFSLVGIFGIEQRSAVSLLVLEETGTELVTRGILAGSDLLGLGIVALLLLLGERRSPEWTMESGLPFTRARPIPQAPAYLPGQGMPVAPGDPYGHNPGPLPAGYRPVSYHSSARPEGAGYGCGTQPSPHRQPAPGSRTGRHPPRPGGAGAGSCNAPGTGRFPGSPSQPDRRDFR